MQIAKGSFFAAALLLAVLSLATGASRFPPRLYGEHINARAELPSSRADLNFRLPNNTVPISYDIELTTNVHTGETPFTGIVKIELMTKETTNYVTLHARQISGFQANIRPRDNPQAAAIPMTAEWEEQREFLTLKPIDENVVMPQDTFWILTVSYSGNLREDRRAGFYIASYNGEDGKIHYLAATQFESTNARNAFPCYDEPAIRTTFNITIFHSPTYTANSNMPVDIAKSSPGITVFQSSPKMPTYIVAFTVTDYKSSEGTLNGLPQRIFSRPGTEHYQEFGLVTGMLMTARLGEYYNIPYPLPKLDQTAIPGGGGAMENWGLAIYGEEVLLYNQTKSTVNTQTNVATIIAHEYAHMWFGDLVTIRWWTYLWLKEGFATLFEYGATDFTYPEWSIWQNFHISRYQDAMEYDANKISRPLTHYVQTPAEISSRYDSISYAKGGCVLSMFRHALTDEVFRLGVNKFLTTKAYDSAVEEDLFSAMQSAAKELNKPIESEIQAMMASWTRHNGYPVLTVTRNYADGSFKVKQEQFYDNEELTGDYTWYVPFNYIDATNWDFRDTAATHFLKREEEISVQAKINEDDWLLLNKQSTGYYRINYDNENWRKIIDGLWHMPYRFHPRNRAQLMHDAYAFASSKRLDHDILLSMMLYLSQEDQYAPWATANGILNTFNRYLSGDKNYRDFQEFIAERVTDIYNKLGVNDVPGEQHLQKFTRSIAINLACLGDIEACLKDTNNKLKASINNNIDIEPNLMLATYCNGLKQSSNSEFDYVYNKLMNSADEAERRLLISALGCSQQETQLKKFVASSIDQSNKLRTQERTTLLSSAYSRGEIGLFTSIDFLDKNWEEYNKLTPGFGGASPLQQDLLGMSVYCVTEDQRNKLNALVQKVQGAPGLSSTISISVNSNIEDNMKWLQQNRDPLINGIRNLRNSSASLTASVLTIALAFFATMLRFL